ncbi:2Fe-2S iron-sulfur cluster-binding protein [Cellvibrio sp. OA-2007]|uniref:2Fe-2S iron-sulfur cluster-binding protein n=1 Tax=Cellvibrio sp. OA-2007 TaxID=529823 RepID=UPI00078652AB|nr:2Fe-2S iron-sulfur cluster-binding protein [Cellvibrio sp. OA-2007]
MAKITFITPNKDSITLEATSGSAMELAVNNGIPGIGGDCGGVCSCATCHVYVPAEHASKLNAASEIEKDMLELDDNVNEFSRLCCQIEITPQVDGLVLEVVG